MLSEVEGSRGLVDGFRYGMESLASHRKLLGLRSSLHFARNDSTMNPILALDFGRARIGVAISDELQFLAHPLETIPTTERPESRVAKIVGEKKVDHVVVGIPKQMNGQIGTAATEVLEFVKMLRAILPCPVVTWDERLTTVAAHRVLRDAGKKARNTRRYVDQVAAQMILQSYLDRRAEKAASGM